jgi:hypothetical protein
MSARVHAIRGSVAALLATAMIVLAIPALAQAQPPAGGGGGGKVTCEAPGGGLIEAGDEVTVIIRDTKTRKVVAKHEYICGNDGKLHTIGLHGKVPRGRAVVMSTIVTAAAQR